MLKQVNYDKHRHRIVPIIEHTATRNRHDFANDVDRALLSGRAFLFVSSDGFVALQPMSNKRVLVLFAFSFSGDEAMAKYDDEIVKLAKKIDAEKLIFQSTRKGFRRLARRFGYQVSSRFGNRYTYSKEI